MMFLMDEYSLVRLKISWISMMVGLVVQCPKFCQDPTIDCRLKSHFGWTTIQDYSISSFFISLFLFPYI